MKTKQDTETQEPTSLRYVAKAANQIEAVEEEVQELKIVTQEPAFLKPVVEAAVQIVVAIETYEAKIQTESAVATKTQEVET